MALRLDTDWIRTFGPAFFAAGPETREILLELLPDDFDWEGKRVMDFGCGVGRTLMHFREEAELGEIWGVDLDAGALRAVEQNLCPPVKALRCEIDPPLPFEDSSFDLIWAISVWTHLTDTAHAWMAEMHRLLKPGGLLIPTYMGERYSELLAGEPWHEDRIGMNVLRNYQGSDQGAPMVLISDWWMREHWGRAFEVIRIEHGAHDQNWPLLRRRDGEISAAEIERRSDDAREWEAVRHNLKQVQREVEMALREGAEDVEAERERAERLSAEYEGSLSWRVTRPLRGARQLWRQRRAARDGPSASAPSRQA